MKKNISKTALTDQHGAFQHFQVNTTEYATRDRYLSMRGGEKSIGRDTESLYNLSEQGKETNLPTEYVAPHLSTRYSPDRVGVQAQRVSDGVYQDPYTNKVYDYNEGFKTEDGRDFPGGSAALQSGLMRMSNILDRDGLVKHADRIDLLSESLRNKALSGAGLKEGLTVVANSLDEIGRHSHADYVDSLTQAVCVAEGRPVIKLANLASHLDDKGHSLVADILDTWMSSSKK